MKKYSPLIAAILGAIALILQQYVGKEDVDFKVIGFAVLIAVLGVVSVYLKGKTSSIAVILGTVGYTLYDMLSGGTFTWEQFIITGLLAVITVLAPSITPEPEDDIE
jgi:ABC-type branched-subunit amino acid transport system permease subunit